MFSILLTICVLLFAYLFLKKNDYWKKRNVVHVQDVLPGFFMGKRSLAEVYRDVYDAYPNEPYVGMHLGSTPALLIRDLENVNAVLSGDFKSFSGRGILTNPNDLLADNVLFIDDYKRWKLIRQKVSPIFTSAKLRNMFYIMERCARDFVVFLEKDKIARSTCFKVLYNYTTASIAASIFGIDTKTQNTMESPFHDMSWDITNPRFKTNFRFFIANTFPSIYKLLKVSIFDDHEDFFIGTMKSVLKHRRQESELRHDYIDLCLELQKQGTMRDPATGYELEPTDEVLAAQAFFFFLAGTDTSANTMHFTLLELANHPDILAKVHGEVDEVFRQCDEKLTYDAIDNLKYLEMVVDEALRINPPIGSIQRKCVNDTILPVGDAKIEKDTVIVLPVYAIHRDEKNYPNPDVFDPERFNADNVNNIPKSAFLPFSEGNRFCLGARFARLQVKSGLAWVLRRFTLKKIHDPPKVYEPSFFALRRADLKYELIPRDGAC